MSKCKCFCRCLREQAINQMHAIPRNILRMMLRLRSHLRQLARIQLRTRFRMQMHHANGE